MPIPEHWSGRQIGDFIVAERIARGGLSSIYRARQLSVNRFVALKIIDLGDEITDREGFRQSFEKEAGVTATLEHIHILPVYGYSVDDHYAYIAMRLLSGGSLADLVKKAPVSFERVSELLNDIAQGLDYAHRKGILHGDLKPSNILLDDAGRAYITDFGVAMVIAGAIDVGHNSQSLIQMPLYAAPERLRGEEGDWRADIYSLGAILYHLVSGRPPFEMDETGIGGLVYRHLEQNPFSPKTYNPTIPPALEGVILRAIRKNPADRFANATDLAEAFNTAIGKSTLEWKVPTLPRPARLRGRRWLIPIGIAALVIVLLGVALFALRTPISTTQPPVVILDEQYGTIDSVMPTQALIDQARSVLGTGFIAYLNCSLDNIQDASRSRRAREIASQFGLRLEVYDAKDDLYTQLTQVEQAQLDGARAFILCPTSSEAFVETAQTFQESNIPLVWVTLANTEYGVKLDADNYAIGQQIGLLAGEIFARENGGAGNYVIIHRGSFPATQQHVSGMRDGIVSLAPEANLIEEISAEGRELRDAAEEEVGRLLDEGVPLDAVLCGNDSCAYGATNALNEAQVSTDDIFIVSAGGEPFALDLLRANSFLRGTVAINREISSHLMVYATIYMLAGSPVPEILSYPPGEMVTQDNVNTFVPN